MIPIRSGTGILLCAVLALADTAKITGSVKDIQHVVLFMQENRAYDHYYGTLAGGRGFADPNVQINPDGRNTFQQPVPSSVQNVSFLQPWHINYLEGTWPNATQCMGAGDNSWSAMHTAWNNGLNNQWVIGNTAYSVGYFDRADIPVHFDIVEGWTLLDMYQQSILAATDPNRVAWMSGTVNNPGTPNNPDGTGPIILDNNASPGCESGSTTLNCFPFVWKTVPEYWQNANVSWQLYQDNDNFEDNMLAYFKQYQQAAKDSPLTTRGNSYIGFEKFYEDCANGTLPQISILVGPQELSEHPPNLVKDGAWLQKQLVEAVVHSPLYKNTVLIISYDEEGGWADHVSPYHAPKDTLGEWINDPFGGFGDTPVGPGHRVPCYVISPWTRGGRIFSEAADHTSQILFVEDWLTELGYENIRSKELNPWRRDHMSHLMNIFDFENPDYSIPTIAPAQVPDQDLSKPPPKDGQLGALSGNYLGVAECQANYPTSKPPVPYGTDNEHQDLSKLVEEGFKALRGNLTEGRYLTFEYAPQKAALSNKNVQDFSSAPVTSKHDDKKQRWVVHARDPTVFDNQFTISSAADSRYIGDHTTLVKDAKDAQLWTITFTRGKGYALQMENGKFLTVTKDGTVHTQATPDYWQIWSVSYHN